MQQQPGGGGQFSGTNQPNYFMPSASPYQQQQGTPGSAFIHSPGSSMDQTSSGGLYMHHQQQPGQPQQGFGYGGAQSVPAQSELSRQLGFGSAPASVGSPMSVGGGGGFRSQPPSLQQHMLPPTPQPPTPRGGPGSVGPASVGPASIGPIGSVGAADYSMAGYGGPGSVNPATPRSVGEPLSASDQHQGTPMKIGSVSNYGGTISDQDGSQADSPQQQQSRQQFPAQEQSTSHVRSDMMGSAVPKDGSTSASASGSRGGPTGSVSGTTAGTAAHALQNLDQFGPLTLCSMGKEVTQEMLNRTADMLLMLRALTDPMQQFPKSSTNELSQQLSEKQRRLSENLRQTAALMQKVVAIHERLEKISGERLPADAQERIKDLIVPTDTESAEINVKKEGPNFVDELRQQAEQREEYQLAKAEYEKTKQDLMKKREHLGNIMKFLREFCWEISSVLSASSQNT